MVNGATSRTVNREQEGHGKQGRNSTPGARMSCTLLVHWVSLNSLRRKEAIAESEPSNWGLRGKAFADGSKSHP